MTLTDPFVAQRPDGDLPFWRVIAGGDRTGDLVSFGEALLPPGQSGPPPHVHTNEDEAILVVSGVLTVHLGDEVHEAVAGALVWMAREVPHHFLNAGDEPVHAFGVLAPAGLERMFQERDEYLAGLSGPPDMDYIMALNERFGVRPA